MHIFHCILQLIKTPRQVMSLCATSPLNNIAFSMADLFKSVPSYYYKPVVCMWAASPAQFLSPSRARLTDQSLTPRCWSRPRSLQSTNRSASHLCNDGDPSIPFASLTHIKGQRNNSSGGWLCNNIVTCPVCQTAALIGHDITQRQMCKTADAA